MARQCHARPFQRRTKQPCWCPQRLSASLRKDKNEQRADDHSEPRKSGTPRPAYDKTVKYPRKNRKTGCGLPLGAAWAQPSRESICPGWSMRTSWPCYRKRTRPRWRLAGPRKGPGRLHVAALNILPERLSQPSGVAARQTGGTVQVDQWPQHPARVGSGRTIGHSKSLTCCLCTT